MTEQTTLVCDECGHVLDPKEHKTRRELRVQMEHVLVRIQTFGQKDLCTNCMVCALSYLSDELHKNWNL